MTECRARIDHRRLMASVLDRAIADLRISHDLPSPKYLMESGAPDGQIARWRGMYYLGQEVRSWFTSEEYWLFSFRGVCDALDVDPGEVRTLIAPCLPIPNDREWQEHVAPKANYRKSA